MSADKPGSDKRSHEGSNHSGWMDRIYKLFPHRLHTRDDLFDLFRAAHRRKLIDADALGMVEGALQVSETQVRNAMVPRAQMVFVEADATFDEVLPLIVKSGHSRFPVVGEDKDQVIGILLAKDLLKHLGQEGKAFDIKSVLRTVSFIPESKRLNVLLREFRTSRQHMAMVIDEYGGVAGLITIEDVLEEIVGEIDDEHDTDDHKFVYPQGDGRYTVKALMPLDEFNEYFECDLVDDDFDTIGGLVVGRFGHLPQRGEGLSVAGLEFEVLRADSRHVDLLRLELNR